MRTGGTLLLGSLNIIGWSCCDIVSEVAAPPSCGSPEEGHLERLGARQLNGKTCIVSATRVDLYCRSATRVLYTAARRVSACLSLLFERSEFLIATCKKKETDRLSGCSVNLGFSVEKLSLFLCRVRIIWPARTAVQASCGEKHSTEWRLSSWCPQRRSPLVPSRTDSSNLHVI